MDYSYKEVDKALENRISAHAKYSNFNLHEWLIDKFEIKQAGNILDLGCGDGNFIDLFWNSIKPNGKLHAFCHAVPGKWHVMGVMLSAAGSFQWYKNQFGMEEQRIEKEGGANAYETLTKEAQQVIAGSEGLFFLPYLSGERTPHPDPYARGCFIGMSLRHQKKHHTRAVLEGVSYGLNDSLSMMKELGVNPNEIILSGGGSRSALWKQMLADIFATPCAMVNALEGAAYGAAILAAVGVGGFGSVQEACSSFIQKIETVDPGPNLETYKRNYPIYKSLYPSLKAQFAKIAESNAVNS